MLSCNRAAFAAFAFALVTSGSLLAQQMTINPSPVLTGGSDVVVTYSNPALAGQSVTIVMTGDDQATKQIVIQLDASGEGSGSAAVPSTWRSAEFQAKGVVRQVLPVR